MKLLLIIISILTAHTCFSQTPDHSTLLYKVDGKESAYPRLSNDDKSILYQSNQNGNWQLLTLDIKSGKNQPVWIDTFNNNFPDWSADNEWITFTSDRDGNEEIYLKHNKSGELKRITNHPEKDIHPYFSPDGKYILWSSTRGNGSLDIYKYSIKTGKSERLTDTPEEETCARYSPDMKHIVFLKNGTSYDDVFIMNVVNAEIYNLTKTPTTYDGWPMFSHDNQWVYYSSAETSIFCLYKIKLDGTEKTKLTSPSRAEEDARVCVSKDGSWLIYNKRILNTIEIRQLKDI